MNQNNLLEKMKNEYDEYLNDLLEKDTVAILFESDRTKFYENMIFHCSENNLTDKQVKTLLSFSEPLKQLFICYFSNDDDFLERNRMGNKTIYQLVKEQRLLDEPMDDYELTVKNRIGLELGRKLSPMTIPERSAYLGAKLQLLDAVKYVVNNELSYAPIDGLSNYYYFEKELVEERLQSLPPPIKKYEIDDEMESPYINSIYNIAELYNWQKDDVKNAIHRQLEKNNQTNNYEYIVPCEEM